MVKLAARLCPDTSQIVRFYKLPKIISFMKKFLSSSLRKFFSCSDGITFVHETCGIIVWSLSSLKIQSTKPERRGSKVADRKVTTEQMVNMCYLCGDIMQIRALPRWTSYVRPGKAVARGITWVKMTMSIMDEKKEITVTNPSAINETRTLTSSGYVKGRNRHYVNDAESF